MDVLSAMKERNSARAYLDRDVARADIEEILASAGYASSARLLKKLLIWYSCLKGGKKYVRTKTGSHKNDSIPSR